MSIFRRLKTKKEKKPPKEKKSGGKFNPKEAPPAYKEVDPHPRNSTPAPPKQAAPKQAAPIQLAPTQPPRTVYVQDSPSLMPLLALGAFAAFF
ncbi:hypothetical protein HF325_000126 [Metschnikowia pulcherrima]|uniref:Uncharacterized protein n=1 Tax=Metschnikowia pulcherrima TaxID=27326 RepID=A0A8H7GY14_9ASCO|nr:hypothetical protein HF325_000126 [Metschnikowia pulcherrima]